jgi:hypothetical protein
MCARVAGDEQVGQGRQHVFMAELPCNDGREAFPAGLVDDGQDTELATLMRAPCDEVVSP